MSTTAHKFPFKILGVADDGRAYFLDRHERLMSTPLDQLSQNKIMNLASITWWRQTYSQKMNREDWLDIQDAIIELSGKTDFDLDSLRGRGAWREKDGSICYHDGQKTIGAVNKNRTYLKKRCIDIGIESEPAEIKTCQEIGHLVSSLNFETKLDTIRCLSWSILSPFSGALPWRPAILITGESGSGKTTVVDYVIKKLSSAYIFNGGESTPAYIRNKIGNDSCAIILDELEADTQRKRLNREELFSMIRQSTSDDAPISGKATRDGGFNEYTMKNMFCCVAISPEIEAVADENRIYRINMVKRQNTGWKSKRENLINLLSDENCASIRALVWQRLPTILNQAEILSDIIQDVTKKDSRSSYADALLFAAYFVIWRNQVEIDAAEATAIISELMGTVKEEKRDETDEIIQRIFAESVYLAESRLSMSMREILVNINKPDEEANVKELKRTAGLYGIAVLESGKLAFQKYNHKISEIIGRGKGYDKLLMRHKNFVEPKNCNITGMGTSLCMVFDIKLVEPEPVKIETEPEYYGDLI